MSRQKPTLAAAASIAAIATAPTPALAAPPIDIPIVNASFENPPLANGTFTLGGVAPWSEFDAFGAIDPPNAILNVPVPDGENVAFCNLTGGATAEQIVDATLCGGDVLTLTVQVGARNDALTFGGYIVALDAVFADDSRLELAVVTSNDAGAVIPAPGQFVEITLTAVIPGHEIFADRVAIRLGSFRVPGQQTFFDDVTLTGQTNSLQVPGCVPTIQDAIDLAEDGDEIVLQPGSYSEHIDFMGKDVTIRSIDPGDIGVVQSTRLVPVFRGQPDGVVPPLVTFASGEGPMAGLLGVTLDNYYDVRVGGNIFISGASPTIDRCIIQGGNADTLGGGVFIENGAPAFEACGFYGNTCELGGGAVYIGPGSDVSIDECEFFENWTHLGSGGVIYIAPDADATIQFSDFGLTFAPDLGGCIFIDSRGDVQIANCGFLGKSSATYGGAIFSMDSAPDIRDSDFYGNEAVEGGAIFAYDGSPTITGCYFDDNFASLNDRTVDEDLRGIGADGGGGAYAQNLGQAAVSDCTFANNEASEGGAVFSRAADISVSDSRFFDNEAFNWGYGGGVNVMGGAAAITRCWFAGNYCGGFGGALAFTAYSDTPDLGAVTNCVFDRNTAADAGGAIFAWGGLLIGNCTFSANRVDFIRFIGGGDALALIRDPGDGPLDVFNSILWGSDDQINASPNGGPINLSHSNIQDDIPFGVTDAGGNIFSYPRFVDINGPDNNPGTLEDNDLSLAANSPCIDAGDTPALTAIDASDLDFLHNTRVLDDTGAADTGVPEGAGVVDMGALEFQGTSDGRCSPADLAEPRGELDFSDVLTFLEAFADKSVDADLAQEFGVLDFSDVFAFLETFGDGCP